MPALWRLYTVVFGDPAYRAFLESVGLTPAKTKKRTLGPLDVPDEFFRDFLRGCIDGDRCIGAYPRKGSSLCLQVRLASVCWRFLVWIQDTATRLAGAKWYLCRQTADVLSLMCCDNEARQLLSWLYYAPDLPCLERKRAVWEDYKQSLPRPAKTVTPTRKASRWHSADEENRTLCGWDVVLRPDGEPLAPGDCLDDGRLCQVCRRILASLQTP